MGRVKVLPAASAALEIVYQVSEPGVGTTAHQTLEKLIRIAFSDVPAFAGELQPISLLGNIGEGVESPEAHAARLERKRNKGPG
jgi:hypothetical protein